MLKRKTLIALTVLMSLAFIAGISALKSAPVFADAADTEVELVYSDETNKVVTGINIPDGAENIEVVIPEGVTRIGTNAFDGKAVTRLTLNEGLVMIDDYAFANTAITSINIPKTVLRIGEHAFKGCTALTDINFATPAAMLEIAPYAFAGCRSLSILNLPDNTIVRQFAFNGCNSLQCVYIGKNPQFLNSAAAEQPDAVFFPKNAELMVIFGSKSDFDKILNQEDKTFKTQHESASIYKVKVNCYIGESEEPVVYERLHGRTFDYVPDKSTGLWDTDTDYSSLPVQDPTYSRTCWYTEATFRNAADYAKVNELLGKESEINLYCHETIVIPTFPAEPVRRVYNKDISYDINDPAQILKALGCEHFYTGPQLMAFDVTVTFADEKGNPADLPDAISTNGVYSAKLSLKPEYGSWSHDVTSSVTIDADTNGFTPFMITLLVVGLVAVAAAVTVSTVVICKKMQARNKKKQLPGQ